MRLLLELSSCQARICIALTYDCSPIKRTSSFSSTPTRLEEPRCAPWSAQATHLLVSCNQCLELLFSPLSRCAQRSFRSRSHCCHWLDRRLFQAFRRNRSRPSPEFVEDNTYQRLGDGRKNNHYTAFPTSGCSGSFLRAMTGGLLHLCWSLWMIAVPMISSLFQIFL